VVAFICNHCPYVKAITDRLVSDAETLKNEGVSLVTINSNDAVSYPEDSFENMARFALVRGFTFPYLHDETQEVARAYGAVCTPDFFGFDRDLILRYRGRLDASRTEHRPPDAKRELVEAMRKIVRTRMGPDVQHPTIGCSIKWKARLSGGPSTLPRHLLRGASIGADRVGPTAWARVFDDRVLSERVFDDPPRLTRTAG
jgi:hypothetical protein